MAFFRRRRNKKSVAVLVLLIVVAGVGFFFFHNIKKAAAEWFDSSWFYRQAVNITNSGTAKINYQASITLDTATLITAGKMQADCDDIRITDINGKVLPYFLSNCNSATSYMWAKIPSIPASGATVYVYYGNPSALGVSNAQQTFNFSTEPITGGSNAYSSYTTGVSISTATSENGVSSLASNYMLKFTGSNDGTTNNHFAYWKTTVNGSNYLNGYVVQSGDFLTFLVYNYDTPGTGIEINFTDASYLRWTHNDQDGGSCLINNSKANGHWYWRYVDLSDMVGKTIDYVNFVQEDDTASETWTSYYNNVVIRQYSSSVSVVSSGSEEKGPAPVAYWRFDEGQGLTAYDDSSNNNDGTLSGTTKPAWQTGDMCVSGKCLKFDGSTSYINVPNASNINFDRTQPFTISLWLKPNVTPSDIVSILTKLNEAVGAKGIWLLLTPSRTLCFLFTDNHTVNDTTLTTSSVLPLNRWTHFVVTYDGNGSTNGMALYINGKLDISGGGGNLSTTTQNTYPLTIGASSNGGRFFNGSLDEVKIYPYARTAAQIKADYNSRGSLSGTSVQVGNQSSWMTNGLVGYWKMDETSGTLADSSGAGNTGTWSGSGASHYTSGKFGNGGGFNGTDDYVAGPNKVLFTTEFTIGTWFYAPAWKTGTADQQMETLVSKWNCANGNCGAGRVDEGYMLGRTYGGANFQININNGVDTTGKSAQVAIGTISAGAWHHAVGVFKGGAYLRLYIDGALVNENTTGIYAQVQDAPEYAHYIGGFSQGYGAFQGSMDEVRIYNRAFSAKEVSDLYNWAPGPVGWWKFDDGTGTSVSDISGNGYSGTLTNGPTWALGKYGGGLKFSESGVNPPNQDVSIANVFTNYPQTSSSAFTQSFWINLTGFPSDHDAQGNDYIRFVNSTATGGLDIRVANSISGSTYDVAVMNPNTYNWSLSSGLVMQTNTWNFVSIVYNNQTVFIYINGVLKASKTSGATLASQTSTTFRPFLGQTCCNGTYQPWPTYYGDDLRYYNYARTQKQIAEDMNAGHPSVGSPVGSYAAWWKFDEGHDNTVYDQSVNANTGTNHGATWTNNGKFGKALNFNGTSSYVGVLGNSNFTSPTGYSWSAWINQASLTDYQAIMSHSDTAGCEDFTFYTSANGTLTFGVDGTGCGQQGYGSLSSSAGAVSVNKWYHVVGVADFSNTHRTYLYINGQQVTSRDVSGINPVNRAMNFSIGRMYDGGGINNWYFNGLIDEVKIYPFALTADDIKTEYNRGAALVLGSLSDTSGLSGGSVASNSASAAYCIPGDTATCNSPVGEWKMDEHTGNTIYDTSGNNNLGNLGGGTAGYMPTWQSSSACHSGSCLKFDGTDDYVDAGSGASLNPPDVITIEAWIKKSDTVKANVINKGSGWNEYQVYIEDTTNAILGTFTYGGIYYMTRASQPITVGVWHHFVETFNTTDKVTVYLDGVKTTWAGSGSMQASVTQGSGGTLQIGICTSIYPFHGNIDDVKIFNYVRTPAQVAWDYNRGKPVGYWKFDECQGTTAGDASGNGNNGAITIGGTGSQTTAGTCTTPTNGTGAWYNGKSGKFNSALSFDGTDDYVGVSDSASNSPTDQVSVSLWIRPTSYTNTGFVWKSSYNYVLYSESDGGPQFILWDNSGNASTAAFSHVLFTLNTWHHLVGTFGSDHKARIFLDGVAVGSVGQAILGIRDQGGDLFMGKRGDGLGVNFSGLIDEVKIYNYALTPTQIKLDYNQGAAVRFGPTTGRP